MDQGRRTANATLIPTLLRSLLDFCSSFVLNAPKGVATMLGQALPFKVIRIRPHDEFQRRADECRRLAASARNASDRAFWLGLVERWQAIESQRGRQSASASGSLPPPFPPPLIPERRVGGARHSEDSPNCPQQAISVDALGSHRTYKAPAAGGKAAGAGSRPSKRR
jgi:hypothetical protein